MKKNLLRALPFMLFLSTVALPVLAAGTEEGEEYFVLEIIGGILAIIALIAMIRVAKAAAGGLFGKVFKLYAVATAFLAFSVFWLGLLEALELGFGETNMMILEIPIYTSIAIFAYASFDAKNKMAKY